MQVLGSPVPINYLFFVSLKSNSMRTKFKRCSPHRNERKDLCANGEEATAAAAAAAAEAAELEVIFCCPPPAVFDRPV